MPTSNSKGAAQKAATLARVRENQRRCRARRREHIAELERKLQNSEVVKDPSEGDTHEKLKGLERENVRLRALLEAVGLPRVWMDIFLKLDGEDGIQNGHFLFRLNIPDITTGSEYPSGDVMVSGRYEIQTESLFNTPQLRQPTPELEDRDSLVTKTYPSHKTTSSEAENDFGFYQWTDMSSDQDFAQVENSFTEPSFETPIFPVSPENQIHQAFPTGTCCSESNNCVGSYKPDGDTTSRSVAFELVRRLNNRGLDMVEIYVRLWSGFRAGEKGREDCTINNKTLFGVLDHISG